MTKEDAEWLSQEAIRVLAPHPAFRKLSVEGLSDVPAAAILAAQNNIIHSKRCGQMPFQPVVDGDLLPDSIVKCWKSGSAKDLDVIIGYTLDEEKLFVKIWEKVRRQSQCGAGAACCLMVVLNV